MKNVLLIIIAVVVVGFGISMFMGSSDGPAEKMGEKIDKTVTDTGNAIEDKCEKLKEKAGTKDTDC